MKRIAPSLAITAVFVLALCAWVPDAAAAEEAKPDKDSSSAAKAAPSPAANAIVAAAGNRAAASEVVVVTNELLERRYSEAPQADTDSYSNADLRPLETAADTETAGETPPPAPAPQVEDPLVWMQKREDEARQRQATIEQAESELAAARQRLAELEKQALAVANPFAARPRLTAEEMETRQTSGETAAQRHARTMEMVEQAREAVAAAEEQLAQSYRQ